MRYGVHERSMAAGAPEQAPLTFDDIAVHFSEEEWDYLAEWQKDLHKNVMWENYEALTSLGFHVARPEVQQAEEVHIGAPATRGDAPTPNKLCSDTGGSSLPNGRTSSEVPRTVAECQEIVVERPEDHRKSSIAVTNNSTITRKRTFVSPALALRRSGCTPRSNHGAHDVSTSSPASVFPKSTANATELRVAASMAPDSTRGFIARAGSGLRVSAKERTADEYVEERIGRAFAEDAEPPRTTLEENALRRNTGQMRFAPRNSEESTSESSSSEERVHPRNAMINRWGSDTSSARHRKRSSRTPRTMRLLLFQQRKILRELRDLRRSNEQLQRSVVQVMEDLHRKPENRSTLPAEEISPEGDTGLVGSEICFVNSPPENTSCQPVAQTSGSQDAVRNMVSDESDKLCEVLSFSSQQHTSPYIDSAPSSCASPSRHAGSMPLDLPEQAMPHNVNSSTALTEALPRDSSCAPILTIKQEPDTVTDEPELRTPVLPFADAGPREKDGESLPDIPLAQLTAERQAVLLRHSRGEPQTLAKFLFQHYVPFHVYETWVHTTNFDGSRNKRAIPRNLRTEIMRFITSRFRLVKKDKKQIRDRINELLRMPRTGGWPVLN